DIPRARQGDEPFLRAVAHKLAVGLHAARDTASLEYRTEQCAFGLTLLHLHEITCDVAQLDAALGAAAMAVGALEAAELPPSATFFVRTWVYAQRLLSRHGVGAEDIRRALDAGKMVLAYSADRFAEDATGRRMLSVELAETLLDQYRVAGEIEILDDALDLISEPQDDTQSLCLRGELCLERFYRLGDREDLTRALGFGARAQSLATAAAHPDSLRAARLLSLAVAERFNAVMNLDELDRAVSYARAAVAQCRSGPSLRSTTSTELASALFRRYSANGKLADLDEAIQTLQRTAHPSPAAPGPHTRIPPDAVLGLALAHHGAHAAVNSAAEVDEGIRLLSGARRTFSGRADLHAQLFRDLASAHFLRFQRQHAQQDIDEAILHTESALERVPAEDALRPPLALQLAQMLLARHALKPSPGYIACALDQLRAAATSAAAPPAVRLRAAMAWAR
ncbi:uncharacterized protein BXZ73DRAFT_25673, partial [Epithele typhae]|uniref:uncharacterized protein n=1 Tax=Epithele typhae TaxID=378194 RepID=UPI002008746E